MTRACYQMKGKCSIRITEEARDLCINDYGMDMVVINDNDIMTEVTQYMNTFAVINYDIWIGMYWDVSRKKFIWVNNEKLSWTPPWYLLNKEPNCMDSTNVHCDPGYARNENCVRMGKSLFKWKTHSCDKRHGVLCQSLSSIDLPATTESSITEKSITNGSTYTTNNSTSTTNATSTTNDSTSPKSKEMFTTTPQTQQATNATITTLIFKTKPTSFIESTEQPLTINTKFITTNKNTSSKSSSEYTTFRTFFNNNTQLCTCKSISIGQTSPIENYRIDKRSTSAYIRRHISIYDDRLSSMVMGYTGSVVICFVVFLMISFDMTNFFKNHAAPRQK
ncbi:Hypothetical predicted protein [Mytilus galloprovincialis]|nr:Hypothetical predicted protein [Mytilus galloprovincialis]